VREIRSILNGNSVNLESMIQNTNIGLIVIRKNMAMRNKDNIIRSLESGSMFKKHYDSDKIVVYKKKEAWYLPHFYVPEVEIYTAQDLSKLPLIIAANSGKIKSSVYFVGKENKKKNAVFDSAELKVKESAEQPVIEYKKINNTKYRVIVHNAKAPFKLIFSESFHEDWKVYSGCYIRQNIGLENSKYRILNGNADTQASIGELRKYVEKGYVSALGDSKEKNAGGEKYYIDYVSKNYNGTIQNDNLNNGGISETWFKNTIIDNTHKMVNGYANSWSVDPEQLFKSNVKCVKKNTDGSYDLELIVEYWHQRMFYLGLFITLTAFAVALAYLVFNYYKQQTGRSAGEKA
jgi:hypothetical protein